MNTQPKPRAKSAYSQVTPKIHALTELLQRAERLLMELIQCFTQARGIV